MTLAEDMMQKLIFDLEIEEARTGKKLIHLKPPVERSDLYYLREICTFFSLLDDEHLDRACDALNEILRDQLVGQERINKAAEK